MKAVWFILALVGLSACNFNAHQFDDRFCSSDSDCTRPDQACVENVCTQKSCAANADCGTGYVFSCTVDGCVAQSCTADAECGVGFACEDHFCAASFNVESATSAGNHALTVTFDGPPDQTTATTLSNYAVSGLDLTGTPTISGSTVTLTTSAQVAQSYTLTVTNVTRASDKAPLGTSTATFTGRVSFNVASATSISSKTVTLTFDGMPDVSEATTLANYSIAGLSLTGTPVILGNTITLATSPQSETSYEVVVSGVHRASDGEELADPNATFDGRNDFNIIAAAAQTSGEIIVTFDAPPDTATATNPASYSITDASANHLDVLGAPTMDRIDDTKVHVATAAQSAVTYTLTVANVKRANDAEPLTITTANFTGRTPFNVASASSVNSGTITVTFDSTPTPAEATDVANYSVPGLTLADPVLSGNKVTLVTSAQSATSYTISVTGVTRQSDAEPLTLANASFTGRAPFDVSGAVSTSTSTVVVTFDAPPNATEAANPANYTIPGVTVTGVTSVQTSIVTLKTTPQSATTFTLTVAGVTRASDIEPLTAGTATFQGRAPFNVIGAVATSSTTIQVMFDSDPDAAEATKLQNYTANNGLTFSGVTLLGATATLTTSTQDSIGYSVFVSNVTRASDAEALTVQSASFTGRKPFKVVSAASTSNIAVTVTFDAAPEPAEAAILANYQITSGNLSLTGTPVLSGNTVTITTSQQSGGTPYTITVSNVTRAGDDESLSNGNADFTGRSGFNVAGASSVSATSISISFDGTPNTTQATTLGNYAVRDANNNVLALSGTPMLAGNTVTITTAPQAAGSYTVKVTGVTRTDATPLSIDTATFTHTAFNVSSAAATNSREIRVMFDAPPNPGQATTLASYTITCGMACGLPLSTVTLAGSTVTIKTAAQTAGRTYTITVNGVTRASDGSPLTTSSASFTGIGTFNVASAASTNSGTITVTFDAPPNPTQATTLANYNIANLTLLGTPVLSGTTVTLSTSVQQTINYTISVANVTRATDSEPLFVANATFLGKAQQVPTVTGVAVLSTSPNNGTKFYNTGTATVLITGTELSGVSCPSGVQLDDLNGAGVAINTHPISCTVDSATQITATFPAGIRTNGTLGWNVQATNSAGTNATSSVKLVVYAGLLVSEVFAGQNGAGAKREFVEIYNPTGNAIDLSALGLAVHIRAGNTDVNVTWSLVDSSYATIASHGYWLLSSTQSTMMNGWYSHRDATWDANTGEMAGDSGVYLSLSSTAQNKVLDKVGWHNQAALGYEGTPVANNLPSDNSIQRKPAGGNGASTDTDVNASDFNAPNASTTPRGTVDPAEP